MSDAAVLARSKRRDWAATGSGHDRLLSVARVALPSAVGVLAVLLVLAPTLGGRDISFVLSKDRVAVAHERMRVEQALYRGRDTKDQPFQLRAVSAIQASSSDPTVRLRTLDARIRLADGPASIVAGSGRYDMDNQTLAIDGPVTFNGPQGYRMNTRDVAVDLKTRSAVSGGPVDGSTDLGMFRANRLRADLETRVVRLDGAVRLHIVRARAK